MADDILYRRRIEQAWADSEDSVAVWVTDLEAFLSLRLVFSDAMHLLHQTLEPSLPGPARSLRAEIDAFLRKHESKRPPTERVVGGRCEVPESRGHYAD